MNGTSANLDFILSLGSFTLGYLVYFFVRGSSFVYRKISPKSASIVSSYRAIMSQKWLGFFFLGLIPGLLLYFFGTNMVGFYGLTAMGNGKVWLITSGLSVLVICLNYLNCRKPSNLAQYPLIRISQWSASILFTSALSWIVYLMAYEFVLRGLILQPSIEILGTWSAIVLNLSLYALIHVPKGLTETVGSIPFGLVLCLLVISSGSIWPAVFLHAVLALSNEWLSLYFHPDINVKWK